MPPIRRPPRRRHTRQQPHPILHRTNPAESPRPNRNTHNPANNTSSSASRRAQRLRLRRRARRNETRHLNGADLRHRNGLRQALEPLRHVCVAGAASARRGHDVARVYEQLACAAGVGWAGEADGCVADCVWGAGGAGQAVYTRYGAFGCGAGEGL